MRPFALRIMIALLLTTSLTPRVVGAAQSEAQRERSEYWLTVRLAPNVRAETLDLIADATEFRTTHVVKGEPLDAVLARAYGFVTPSARERFLSANRLSTGVTSSPRAGEAILPPAPVFDVNVAKSFPKSLSIRSILKQEVGVADAETIDRLYARNVELGSRTVLPTGEKIVLPNVPALISFRLLQLSDEQRVLLLDRLGEDPGVLERQIGRSMTAGPDEPPRALAPLDLTPPEARPGWPYTTLQSETPALAKLVGNYTVTVAVIDSGIPYADVRFPYWKNVYETTTNGLPGEDDDENGHVDDIIGVNFTAPNVLWPVDDFTTPGKFNHGTHVAGIASGRMFDASLRSVLDQRTRLMVLKVISSHGDVPPAGVRRAVEYAIDMGADVINISIEGPDPIDGLEDLIRASRHTVLFVLAAGNRATNVDAEGEIPLSSWAHFAHDYENVITVAAHNAAGERIASSSYGARSVSLAAPGDRILSTVSGFSASTLTGTSQAAPFVTFAATLLHTRGVRTPNEIKDRLLSSTSFDLRLQNQVATWGRLDIARALDLDHDVVKLVDGTVLQGKIVNRGHVAFFAGGSTYRLVRIGKVQYRDPRGKPGIVFTPVLLRRTLFTQPQRSQLGIVEGPVSFAPFEIVLDDGSRWQVSQDNLVEVVPRRLEAN